MCPNDFHAVTCFYTRFFVPYKQFCHLDFNIAIIIIIIIIVIVIIIIIIIK